MDWGTDSLCGYKNATLFQPGPIGCEASVLTTAPPCSLSILIEDK